MNLCLKLANYTNVQTSINSMVVNSRVGFLLPQNGHLSSCSLVTVGVISVTRTIGKTVYSCIQAKASRVICNSGQAIKRSAITPRRGKRFISLNRIRRGMFSIRVSSHCHPMNTVMGSIKTDGPDKRSFFIWCLCYLRKRAEKMFVKVPFEVDAIAVMKIWTHCDGGPMQPRLRFQS